MARVLADDPNLGNFIDWMEKEWSQLQAERAVVTNCNRGHNTSFSMHQYYHGERLSRPVSSLPDYFENRLQTGKNAAKVAAGKHKSANKSFTEAIADCRKITTTEA